MHKWLVKKERFKTNMGIKRELEPTVMNEYNA